MNLDAKVLTVNGIDYVPKDSIQETVESVEGYPYCIVRTQSAGVFAGYLKSRSGKEVEVLQARRLWYWVGAASLSQLSLSGVSRPSDCKFPASVASVLLTEVIEILPATAEAKKSIDSVKIWQA